jgi:hypothetical protein
MKTKICVAALIGCVATAGKASAQYCELERLRVVSQGEGASADFSSVDTSTCALGIETTVHVEGSQGVITAADHCGRGANHITTVTETQTSVVAVLVTVYDRCLDTEVLSVTGIGEAEELHVSNNFKTASIRADLQGVDDFDQPVAIAIDLVWNGVGPKERTMDHTNSNEGIVRFVSTSSGTIRDAVAAGSVLLDGADKTPLPSTQGTIEKDASHGFIVYR